MKKLAIFAVILFASVWAQGAFAHCDPSHVESLTLAHCDPSHVESLTLAVERRSCHCGFTAAGDCKPCGSGGSAIRGKRCMYGYDEQGNCLKKGDTDMKQCKCGYDAGKCLPCKDSLIERSKNK